MSGCWLIFCGGGFTLILMVLRLLLWPLRLAWRALRWLIESSFNWVRGQGFRGNQHTESDPFERFDSDFEAALRRTQGRLGALPPSASRGFASQSASAFPAPAAFPAPSGQFPAPSGQFPAPQGQFPAPSGQFPAPSGQFPAPSGQFSQGQVNPNFRRPSMTPGREYQPTSFPPSGQFPAQPVGFPPSGQFPAQPGPFPAQSGGQFQQPGPFPAQPGGFPLPGPFPAQPGGFPPSGQFPAPQGGPLPPLPPLGGSSSAFDVDAERERQRRRDEGDTWGGDLLGGLDGLLGG